MKPSKSLVLPLMVAALATAALVLRALEPEEATRGGLSGGPSDQVQGASPSADGLRPAPAEAPSAVAEKRSSTAEGPVIERADASGSAPWIDPSTHVLVTGRVVEYPVEGEREPSRPGASLPITLKIGRVSIPATESLTDAEGRFRFEIEWPEDKTFVYTLRVPGDEVFRPIRHQQTLRHGTRASEEEELPRVVHGRPRGVVVDERGERLAGVEFTWRLTSATSAPPHLSTGTVTTDALGEWRIEEPIGDTPIVEELASHEVIRERPSRAHHRGGWREGHMILRARGSLGVRVTGNSGVPRVGAEVRLGFASGSRMRWSAKTDEDGLALLSGLPTSDALRVVVQHEGARIDGTRQSSGRLIPTPSDAGEEILVADSWPAPLEVHLATGTTLVVRGAGLDGTRVHFAVLYSHGGTWQVRHESADAGQETRFELPGDLDQGEVWVRARAHDGSVRTEERPRNSGPTPRPSTHVAEREVLLRQDGQPTEVTLDLEPALRLRGSIVGEESSRAVVRVRPEGAFAELKDSAGETIYTPRGSRRREFEVAGLAPGHYTLEARSAKLGLGGTQLVREHVAAGTDGIEFDMSQSLGVEIELVLPEDQPKHDSLRVVVLRLAQESAGAPVSDLEHSLVPRADAAPREVLGRWSRVLDSPEELLLPPATEGVYVLQVSPRGEAGARFATVLSEPMLLSAGKHQLTYAVVPCGRVSIRFPGEGMEGHAVQLVDGAGRAFPDLDTGIPPATLHVRGRRRFLHLKDVPVGSYGLRLGPAEDLALGRAQRTLAVEVRADETTSVHLDE